MGRITSSSAPNERVDVLENIVVVEIAGCVSGCQARQNENEEKEEREHDKKGLEETETGGEEGRRNALEGRKTGYARAIKTDALTYLRTYRQEGGIHKV